MQDLEKLVAEATALFAGIDDADALEQAKAMLDDPKVRAAYLGE